MKPWLAAMLASLAVASSHGAVVYTSVADFEAAVGTPRQSVDLAAGALPRCTEVWYYQAYGQVIGSCIASYTMAGGSGTYTVRGNEAWLEGLYIRSSQGDGSGPNGPGSAYVAHLWSGPGGNIVADPVGGNHLALEVSRQIEALGIHTTSGFFGWREEEGVDSGLLILPSGAEITRLEFDYRPNAIPEPASILLVSLAGLGVVVAGRRRARGMPSKR